MAAWFEANGYTVKRLPPLIAAGQRIASGQAPVIRSPASDTSYFIRPGVDPEYQKICLEAAAARDAHQLYWFINGEWVGTALPGQRLFIPPRAGTYRVVCQDDQGRSAEVRMVVEDDR